MSDTFDLLDGSASHDGDERSTPTRGSGSSTPNEDLEILEQALALLKDSMRSAMSSGAGHRLKIALDLSAFSEDHRRVLISAGARDLNDLVDARNQDGTFDTNQQERIQTPDRGDVGSDKDSRSPSPLPTATGSSTGASPHGTPPSAEKDSRADGATGGPAPSAPTPPSGQGSWQYCPFEEPRGDPSRADTFFGPPSNPAQHGFAGFAPKTPEQLAREKSDRMREKCVANVPFPTFSGKAADFKTWSTTMSEVLAIKGLATSEWSTTARLYLSGPAKAYVIRYDPHMTWSYEELIESLDKEFRRKSAAQAVLYFDSIEQSPNESAAAYLNRLETAMQDTHPELSPGDTVWERLLSSKAVLGLKPEIRERLSAELAAAGNYEHLKECIRSEESFLETFQQIGNTRSRRGVTPTSPQRRASPEGLRTSNSRNGSVTFNVNAIAPEDRADLMQEVEQRIDAKNADLASAFNSFADEIRGKVYRKVDPAYTDEKMDAMRRGDNCFYCGQPGHIARNCRKRLLRYGPNPRTFHTQTPASINELDAQAMFELRSEQEEMVDDPIVDSRPPSDEQLEDTPPFVGFYDYEEEDTEDILVYGIFVGGGGPENEVTPSRGDPCHKSIPSGSALTQSRVMLSEGFAELEIDLFDAVGVNMVGCVSKLDFAVSVTCERPVTMNRPSDTSNTLQENGGAGSPIPPPLTGNSESNLATSAADAPLLEEQIGISTGPEARQGFPSPPNVPTALIAPMTRSGDNAVVLGLSRTESMPELEDVPEGAGRGALSVLLPSVHVPNIVSRGICPDTLTADSPTPSTGSGSSGNDSEDPDAEWIEVEVVDSWTQASQSVLPKGRAGRPRTHDISALSKISVHMVSRATLADVLCLHLVLSIYTILFGQGAAAS